MRLNPRLRGALGRWILRDNFVSLVLKELVNRESETDHRKSGPDPRHECSFGRDNRALVGWIGSLFGEDRSPSFAGSTTLMRSPPQTYDKE